MKQVKVNFDNGIFVGKNEDNTDKTLNEVTISEPNVGSLRGISLKSLLVDLDTEAWVKVLSRNTTPMLSEGVLSTMGTVNFSKLMTAAMELIVEGK